MSRPAFGRGAALCSFLAGALLGGAAGLADEPSVVTSPETARDFMIQNIWIDGSRAVLVEVSPIDGDPRCVARRDLMPGENLPYHKHDHPAARDQTGLPGGYQRHDSFPIETALFGVVIEHSFDFGAGGGRQFGASEAHFLRRAIRV